MALMQSFLSLKAFNPSQVETNGSKNNNKIFHLAHVQFVNRENVQHTDYIRGFYRILYI